MRQKSLTRSESNFYLPGEEIDLQRQDMFAAWDKKSSSGYRSRGRIFFASFCALFAYFLVALRLLHTCVLPHYAETQTEGFYAAHQNIHRADILDRNGSIVATSLPTKDLDAKIKNILSPRETAQKLAHIFKDRSFDYFYKRLKNGRGTVTLYRNLTPHQQSLIMALGNPGLEFRPGEKRVYPHKNLLSHLIGTADIDNVGTAGVEKGLNERITHSEIPVTLSVDLGVQDTIRGILQTYMKKFHADSATSILMNVKTGEVVSMVSLPDFDPNDIKQKDVSAMLNTATSRVYEPGSVLKVFNTAMALESGKVKVSEKFDTTKPLKLKYNTIYEYHGQNRALSVEEILVYSSNVGSAKMALQAGFSEQYNFLKKIKMLDRLKMELIETAQPLVMPVNKWKMSDSAVATIGYGYGLSVSPLHLVSAFSAVVNGGIYHDPTVLALNGVQREGLRVMSDTTSKQMRKLLRAVVTEGSGKRANVAGYEVGGKTGTANKLDTNGKYGQKHVRTTFLSAFPISNPQYALVVMMDDPKATKETFGFSTAGWNAVPASSEIISAVAPQLNIPANFDLEEQRQNKIIEASYER